MPLATFRAISQKTKSVESITQGSVFTNGAADGGVALSQRKTHLRKEELILANRQQLSEMQKDCDLKSMIIADTEKQIKDKNLTLEEQLIQLEEIKSELDKLKVESENQSKRLRMQLEEIRMLDTERQRSELMALSGPAMLADGSSGPLELTAADRLAIIAAPTASAMINGKAAVAAAGANVTQDHTGAAAAVSISESGEGAKQGRGRANEGKRIRKYQEERDKMIDAMKSGTELTLYEYENSEKMILGTPAKLQQFFQLVEYQTRPGHLAHPVGSGWKMENGLWKREVLSEDEEAAKEKRFAAELNAKQAAVANADGTEAEFVKAIAAESESRNARDWKHTSFSLRWYTTESVGKTDDLDAGLVFRASDANAQVTLRAAPKLYAKGKDGKKSAFKQEPPLLLFNDSIHTPKWSGKAPVLSTEGSEEGESNDHALTVMSVEERKGGDVILSDGSKLKNMYPTISKDRMRPMSTMDTVLYGGNPWNEMELSAIDKVVYGAKTRNFQRRKGNKLLRELDIKDKNQKHAPKSPYYFCFSLIVEDRTIDLSAPGQAGVLTWVRGLMALTSKDDWKKVWSRGRLLWRMTVYRMQADAEVEGVSIINKVAQKMNLCVEQTRPFTPGTHMDSEGHVEDEEIYDDDEWDPDMSQYSSARGEGKSVQQETDEWAEFGLVKTDRGSNTARGNNFLTARKSKTVFNAVDEGLKVTLEWKANADAPLGIKVEKRIMQVEWVSAPATNDVLEFVVQSVDVAGGTVTIGASDPVHDVPEAVFKNPTGKPMGGTGTSETLKKGLAKRSQDSKRDIGLQKGFTPR